MAADQDKVLVIEDEPDIRELVEGHLTREGYRTIVAGDGRSGLREFYQHRPDLVLLDIMMPEMDGWEVCRRIREVSDTPIIVLSARAAEADRVRGLNLGADDYLLKPFGQAELLARVRAVLRRYRTPAPEAEDVYADSRLRVDFGQHVVSRRGEEVPLSAREFSLLTLLVKNAGRVLTHEQILDRVWGFDYDSLDAVKQYISDLRRKLEDDPHHPELIRTVRGVGYRYTKPG